LIIAVAVALPLGSSSAWYIICFVNRPGFRSLALFVVLANLLFFRFVACLVGLLHLPPNLPTNQAINQSNRKPTFQPNFQPFNLSLYRSYKKISAHHVIFTVHHNKLQITQQPPYICIVSNGIQTD
jgi:hypothetical protein